ncbi:TPA: hypothetical protein QHI28_003697 [Enterobacter roggenkampii]|nr:hypothetical protein [Enterobacter roggenkampii]
MAEQLLEIGVKAGLTGAVAKMLADKLTADELDHLVTLQMTGNDEITSKYLGLLQDKYAPEALSNPHLGKGMDNDQKAELGGAGSGTPGGWGPEDEEKARAQQAQIEAKKQVESLGYDSNKVSHIFADKHQMDKLVSEFGSPEAALERMHEAVQPLAKNPGSYQTGSWVTVRVGGNDVTVKGIVINGEFRISTATMRPF